MAQVSRQGRFRQALTDTSTAQTIVLADAPRLGPPRFRRTRLTRTWEPGGDCTVELRPAHGSVLVEPPAAALAGLTDGGGDMVATLTVTTSIRRYADSDGLRFTTEDTWVDLHLTAGPDNAQLTDGCAAITEVPRRLASMAAELSTRPGGPPQRPPTGRVDLLLTPTVAGVLIHEMVGHHLEQRPPSLPPGRIASPDLTVTARTPRPSARDDDGVLTAPITLVDGGFVGGPLLDRHTAAQHGGRPCGLAQAALHHGPPMTRCTHLNVLPGSPTHDLRAEAPAGLVCLATSGAEYLHGEAVLVITAGYRLADGRAVAPFLLIVKADDLHRLQVGDDTGGRSARCVKAGQSLPTHTIAPTMLLPEATIHAC